VKSILDRHKRLAGNRGQWEALWQELAEVFLPFRANFTTAVPAGAKRALNYDSAPMLARRQLASAIDGLLKPETTRWFDIRTGDAAVDELDEVKAWLDDSANRLYRAIYNAKARFIERSQEVDDDLVTFGAGCLFVGEGRTLNRLLFQSFHLKDVYPAENADGDIDTMHIALKRTARQAAQQWGEENLGEKTREALDGTAKDKDRPFDFLWVVQPREDRDPRRRDNRNLPWASAVIDIASEHLVEETGFHEFPFAFPRWDTASGELFGRSPGMLALADSRTLQAMGKTILVAGQKAADPPLLVPSDGLIGAPRTFPGGITTYDSEVARDLGGRVPIQPMNTGANIPIVREMQQDTREQIFAAYFRPVLRLFENANMTATEVLERKEEFVRTIGPVFGRLKGDYLAPVVERAFNIMLRAGAFAALPEALDGREIRFQYASPVEQARKQLEAAGVARSFELLAPLAQVQPEIWDNFDGDEIARDTPEIFGAPRKWLRPREAVAGLRAERALARLAQQGESR